MSLFVLAFVCVECSDRPVSAESVWLELNVTLPQCKRSVKGEIWGRVEYEWKTHLAGHEGRDLQDCKGNAGYGQWHTSLG